MSIKNIFLVIFMLFLLSCSRPTIGVSSSSSSCSREVSSYSLDALDKEYSCQEQGVS